MRFAPELLYDLPRNHCAICSGIAVRFDADFAGLVFGETVTILETWTDGKDTWAKIGPDQWSAMIYNNETYIKENG